MYMYIYIYIYTYVYMYIYIYHRDKYNTCIRFRLLCAAPPRFGVL